MALSGAAKDAVSAVVRVDWSLLPAQVRADVEALTGSPVAFVGAPRGCSSPGVAACLRFTDGTRRFLRGIAVDHVLFPRYHKEAAINRVLRPAGAPVPRLRRAWQVHGWWLMAFDDISGARHPDLTPGSPDIVRVLALLDRLPDAVAQAMVPDAPDLVPAVGDELCGWRHLAETGAELDPWAARNLDRLAATERFWRVYGEGTTLLHADLGPDTVLLAEDAAGDVVIDWAYLHRGAAWIDAALFLPHLIQAGHYPAQAEALMASSVAAWVGAPPEAVTFFAIALTGYWERSSRLPTPLGAPQLRPYQAHMADIGRSWIRHRTEWT